MIKLTDKNDYFYLIFYSVDYTQNQPTKRSIHEQRAVSPLEFCFDLGLIFGFQAPCAQTPWLKSTNRLNNATVKCLTKMISLFIYFTGNASTITKSTIIRQCSPPIFLATLTTIWNSFWVAPSAATFFSIA